MSVSPCAADPRAAWEAKRALRRNNRGAHFAVKMAVVAVVAALAAAVDLYSSFGGSREGAASEAIHQGGTHRALLMNEVSEL
jgi:hypothetical protein